MAGRKKRVLGDELLQQIVDLTAVFARRQRKLVIEKEILVERLNKIREEEAVLKIELIRMERLMKERRAQVLRTRSKS